MPSRSNFTTFRQTSGWSENSTGSFQEIELFPWSSFSFRCLQGFPGGAAGLPGRQISQRPDLRTVRVAPRRDAVPTLDLLRHPTLLRTRRETPANNRDGGQAAALLSSCSRPWANKDGELLRFSSWRPFIDNKTRSETWRRTCFRKTWVKTTRVPSLVCFRPSTRTSTSVWVLANTKYQYRVDNELVLKH